MENNNKSKPYIIISAVLILLIWSFVTILLAISVVGWVVLAMMLPDSDDDKDSWYNIPNRCINLLK